MVRRKALLVVTCIAVALFLIAGGWFAASLLVSPQQAEANATPPKAEPIVAAIARADLVESRTMPAAVGYADRQTLPLSPITDATRSVVTETLIAVGTSATAGTPLVRVNDTPVFLFESPFPFYRDIGMGDTGADVTELQRNLSELGLLEQVDGVFGTQTARAVARMFENSDAAAPTRTIEADASQDNSSTPESAPESVSAPRREAYVPLTSMLAVPQTPAVVRSVPLSGTILAEDTQVTFDSALVEVQISQTSPSDVLFSEGDRVEISIDGGIDLAGVVTSITKAEVEENGEESAAAATQITVAQADGQPISTELIGRPASVTMKGQVLASDALVVPLAAVSEGKDKSTMLLRQEDGSFESVNVEVIAVLGGQVAIHSADPRVIIGAQVRVG